MTEKIIGFLVSVGLWMLVGLFVMLGIGVVHADVLHDVKACGYGTSLWLTILFGMAVVIFSVLTEG
jgi:hypothetical protein